MNVKAIFNEYLNESYSNIKYFAIYFVFILALFFVMATPDTYVHPKMEILCFIFMTLFGWFIIDYHTLHKDELHKTAFILILVTGVFLAIFTPITLIADEHEHFARAVITATGNLFPQFSIEHNGFSTIALVNDIHINEGKTIFNSGVLTSPINYSSIYYRSAFQHMPFYAYLFSGFGVWLAQLFNLPTFFELLFGRIFNVFLYASLVAIAIKKSPVFKGPLFIVACMPMVMFQAASISSDVIINGLAFVIIGYFLYMLKGDVKVSKKELGIFFLLVCLIGMCKVTFFAFFLMIFIIPRNKFEKNCYFYAILAFGIICVFAYLFSNYFANPYILNSFRADYMANNNVSTKLQMKYLLDNPQSFLVILSGIPRFVSLLSVEMFRFSFLNYKYGSSFINFIYWIFLFALFFFYPIKVKISPKTRIGIFILTFIIFFGTYIILLLTWTPVGAVNNILGGQCRYFVPLFALLPICLNLNIKRLESEKLENLFIILAIGFLAAFLLLTVISWY